jgi:uncharacterized coiled-coil protein SlyX
MTEQPSPGDNGTDQLAALQQQWHDQQQMHEVLLAQQQEIGRLNANLAKVNGNMERLLSGEEMPTPEDDKPPHY